jgi:hypothetical protein
MGRLQGGLTVGELIEDRPVHLEEFCTEPEPLLDLFGKVLDRNIDERCRQMRQQSFEAQKLVDPILRPLPLQGVGEDLADEMKPLHQVTRPRALAAQGSEGQGADGGPRHHEGDGDGGLNLPLAQRLLVSLRLWG